MARPAAAEWSVLDLDRDPVPGDPDAFDQIRSAYEELAQTTQEAYGLLSSGSRIDGGQGQAMEAFKDLIGKLPGRLDTMANSYRRASEGFRNYLPTLEEAQAMSLRALDQAREAAAQQGSAESAAAAAQAALTALTGDAGQQPDPADQQSAQDDVNAARNQRAQAQQALDEAKSLLGQATALRDDAARSTAHLLRELADDAPQRSLWEKIADAFKAFVEFLASTVIQWITTVLDVLATLASFIFPPLGSAIGLLSAGIDVLGALASGDAASIGLALGGIALGLVPGGRLAKRLIDLGTKVIPGTVKGGVKAAGRGLGDGGGKTVRGGLGDGAAVSKNRPANPQDTSVSLDLRNCRTDPVDIGTGEVVLGQTDVDLPGLSLARTHVSSYRAGGWFGPSWASTLDQRLELDAAGVCYFAPDGMILVYPQPGTEPVLPVAGPAWPLTRRADGVHVLHDPVAGRTLEFAAVEGNSEQVLGLRMMSEPGGRVDLRYRDGLPAVLTSVGGHRIGIEIAHDRITGLRLLGTADDDVVLREFRYDGRGFLVDVVDADGGPSRFEYDEAGRLSGWRDSNDVWYRYFYDADGRCVRTEGADGYLSASLAYDRERRITTFTDSLGSTTVFHLDDRNQTVLEIDPLGHETRFEWDTRGRLLATTDPLGRTTRTRYDQSGRVIGRIGADGRRSGPGDAQAPGSAHVLLDPAGLPVAVSNEVGATAFYRHDRFGRIAELVDAAGESTSFGWTTQGRPSWRIGPDGARETWSYDAEGNLLEYVDPHRRRTRFEYAGFDLPVARIDPGGARSEFRYDTELRLVEVIGPSGASWRYEYDGAGRLVRSVDFDGRVREARHDAAGQVVATVDGPGRVTRYAYDVLGRLVERDADGEVSRYAYDESGRLVRGTGPEADVVIERDPAGRVIAEVVNGRRVETDRDDHGRIVRRRTPSGVESRWTYDAAGRPVTLAVGDQVVRWRHDRLGREIERSLGRARLRQSFDRSSRLAAQRVVDEQGRVLTEHEYQYLPGGDLVASGDRRFELDGTGRVIGVRAGEQVAESYEYGAEGNITAATWPGGTAASGAGRRVYQGTLVTRAADVRFEHDEYGRMVSRSVDGQPPERYGWSAEDRLTDVLTAAGERWTYRYDAFGRRIEKQRWTEDGEAAERVEFTWSGDLLVEETQHFVDNSTFVTTWEYHPDDDRVVTQYEQATELLLVVTDQADTPVELVTDQATVSRRRTSTLWGLDTAAATPLRFPGQYHDAETGLHYNRYRYYDPRLGRFLSQDPLGLEPAPNPVGYVDNPHAWIDPLGLTPQGCGAGAGPSTAPPRRSGRAPKPAMALEKEKVWDAQFGPGNQFAGGTGVSVELGPGIRTPGVYGSTPGANENLASGVLNANRFGGHEWKKGHLWNDNLGGPGVSQNLTPMSGVANAKFQGQVEKPLKDALDHARRVGEFEPSRSHWLGVEFTAQKVGQKFPNGTPAEQAIGDYIDVSAYWMKKSKTGGETEFLGPDEQVGLPPLPNGRFDPLTGAFTPHA